MCVCGLLTIEYCKANRNARCVLELYELAQKGCCMKPHGLLRFEQGTHISSTSHPKVFYIYRAM